MKKLTWREFKKKLKGQLQDSKIPDVNEIITKLVKVIQENQEKVVNLVNVIKERASDWKETISQIREKTKDLNAHQATDVQVFSSKFVFFSSFR